MSAITVDNGQAHRFASPCDHFPRGFSFNSL